MKVLQINSVYNNGSTGKIVRDINSYLLSCGQKSVVCYGRLSKINETNCFKICMEIESFFNNLLSRITGIMYGGLYVSNYRLKKIIKREKPDIIHIHCLNGYYINTFKLISWLKNTNLNVVLTLHAEFNYTANCGYALDCNRYLYGCGKCPRLKKETKSLFFDSTHKSWLKMKKAFNNMNNLTLVSVSPWLLERAKASPILNNFDHFCILNGLDTNTFTFKGRDFTDGKTVFHATPYFCDNEGHIKGGYYVLRIAEMLREKNIKFVIAGDYDKNMEVPQNVILLGKITDQDELARLYSNADLTLLCSKKETFSMVVAESLCCGTPIVGFKSGAPEQIAIKEYSEFVDYGDIDEMKAKILDFLSMSFDKNEISKIAKNKYSKEEMAKNYLKLYEKIKERHHE